MKNGWSWFKPDKESQSPSGAKSSKECEGQQERLLQVYHQQKEDYRKCGFAAEWGRDLEKIEQGQGTQCLFTLAFISKTSLQESQAPETSGKVQSKIYLPSVEEDQLREHLSKLDICEYIGSDEMQHECWRSWLISLWGCSLLSLRGHGDQGRVLRTRRKQCQSFFSRARTKIQGSTGWLALP